MIETSEELEELYERTLRCGSVALDTEFVWENSYYPKLGVVQVGFSNQESFLIDVPSIKDFSFLGKILSDERIVKVLHDAQQDLVILHRATNALPKNIYDTRYAAGFSGNKSTISLRDLILSTIAIDIPKTESRTNWLKRPLSDKQIKYAIDDVKYLIEIKGIQEDLAKKNNTLNWLRKDLLQYEDVSN